MNNQSEDALQAECYTWFHNTYKELRGTLFAVPNGGARGALQGKILKRTGVVQGVADMLFMHKGKTYCLEAKTATGYQSEFQKKWQKTIEDQGFYYAVFRSLEQFKYIVEYIIKNSNGIKRS